MIAIRSLIFNAVFYVNLTLFLVIGSPVFLMPRKTAIRALQLWATTSIWWMKIICGTRMEVRGLEHLPNGPLLVAGKHQSFWETFAILPLLDDPCMVLKKELAYIPLFGWYIPKFRMIAVARDQASKAMRKLLADGRREIEAGRQIVIMPEGTRSAPGAPPDYKPGAAALYGALGCPCLPFALNSGLFWPRRKFLRYPGTIVLEFLPLIPAGLPRKEFQQRLQASIEAGTNQLLSEAGHQVQN